MPDIIIVFYDISTNVVIPRRHDWNQKFKIKKETTNSSHFYFYRHYKRNEKGGGVMIAAKK